MRGQQNVLPLATGWSKGGKAFGPLEVGDERTKTATETRLRRSMRKIVWWATLKLIWIPVQCIGLPLSVVLYCEIFYFVHRAKDGRHEVLSM